MAQRIELQSKYMESRLTIRMLESNVDFATSLLSERFLSLMIGELKVATHMPVMQ
jgi:hypothetical protein